MEIKVIKNILGENDRFAAENMALFKDKNVFVVNFMGSPGAGKTSVLERTMEKLGGELRMAVIEGDLFTSKDADRIDKYGVPVIQINTAGGCTFSSSRTSATSSVQPNSRSVKTPAPSCSPSPRATTSR